MNHKVVLLACLLFMGCSRPQLVATFRTPLFQLAALKEQRAAVWPLAKATLQSDSHGGTSSALMRVTAFHEVANEVLLNFQHQILAR